MSRNLLPVAASLAAAQLAIGWGLGFRSPLAYAACWILFGLVHVSAWRLTRAWFPWTGTADAILREAVVAFAGIVAAGLILGATGAIGLGPNLLLSLAGAAATVAFAQPRLASHLETPRIPASVPAILFPLLVLIVAVGCVQSPLTLYDSVSYHLVFPARWLLDQRISIVPTPFSDPAQAYQPGNGELFFLWLMTPFHGDLMARIGQLPFLLIGGVALYALARRCGARPEHAVYAPFFFFLARPVVEQAVGADVDLVCASMFVTSLYLGIVAVNTDDRRDWLLWGASVGLYLGTKYLALVYFPVLLALPFLRGPRHRAVWALPGILGLAAPWYLRNWIVAGSPIYPSSLKLLGLTIARGAFARDAMNHSVFHVTTLRLSVPIVAHAFGAPTLLVWVPAALLGAATLAARRAWWPGAYVLAVPALICPLFWFAVPDNADSRFLLPAVAVAMVPVTFAFRRSAGWNACLHTLYAVGAGWILVGLPRQIPMSLPWFMTNWLTLAGLVSRDALPVVAAGVIAAGGLAHVARRRPALAAPLLSGAFGVACVAAAVGVQASQSSDGFSPLALSPTYIRAEMLVAWDWVRHHLDHATIANTGNNVPYPLFGEHLSNRVRYVNIDRHGDWRFHDYARTRGRTGSTGGDLAQASGQLMPLGEARAASDASRPRYERWEGLPDAWLRNLRDAQASHLFISVLSAYEIDYVWHTPEGFPIEDEWARRDPRRFTLVYQTAEVRMYAIAHY